MPRINFVRILLIGSLINGVRLQCEYEPCSDDSKPGQYIEHTMCRYPDIYLGEKCAILIRNYLDDSEIVEILEIHNDHRQQAKIGPLRWNIELAKIAQRWANQCQNTCDECRNVGGNVVGQNFGIVDSEREFSPFTDLVENWYNYLDHAEVFNPHLIWANTTDVGCGGVKYIQREFQYSTQLVCNYFSENDINSRDGQSNGRSNSNCGPQMRKAPITSGCQYEQCGDYRLHGHYYPHTMCLYQDPEVSAECYNVQQSYLKDEEKQEIVSIVDEARRRYGHNIRRIQWSYELAEVAQRWANQCQVGNDLCRDLERMHVNQNFGLLGRKYGFKYEFSDIVRSWINKSNNIRSHYRYLFWASTTEVGCGGVKYVDVQGYHNTYLVCNYNSLGERYNEVLEEFHSSFGAETRSP